MVAFHNGASIKSKLSFFKHLTIEPLMFIYYAAGEFGNIVFANGLFEVLCLQLTPANEAGLNCRQRTSLPKAFQESVQSLASKWTSFYAIGLIVMLAVCPFYGAISDKYGRKTVILISLAGQILYNFTFLLFLTVATHVSLAWLMLVYATVSATGLVGTMLAATTAYLSDHEENKDRLLIHYTAVQCTQFAAEISVNLVVTFVFKQMSLVIACLLEIAVFSIAFFYAAAFLEEKSPRQCRLDAELKAKEKLKMTATAETLLTRSSNIALENFNEAPNGPADTEPGILRHQSRERNVRSISTISGDGFENFSTCVSPKLKTSKNHSLHAISPISPTLTSDHMTATDASKVPQPEKSPSFGRGQLLREVMRTLRRERKGHFRAYIAVIVCISFLCSLAEFGGAYVFRLYVLGHPLFWTVQQQTTFFGVQSAFRIVGALLFGVVLKRVLKLNESTLFLIAVASQCAYLILLAVIQKIDLMLLAAAASFAMPLKTVSGETLLTQFVDVDETGKIFGVFAVAMGLSALIAIGGLPVLFSVTFYIFPGFVFLILAALVFVALFATLWFHLDYLRYRRAVHVVAVPQ